MYIVSETYNFITLLISKVTEKATILPAVMITSSENSRMNVPLISESNNSELSNNKKRPVESPKFTSTVLNMSNPGGLQPTARHNKEVRQRGCPCCDPDNIDNLIDKMIFLEHAPN